MKIYHGTSDKYLTDILRNGIKPRGAKKSNWEDIPSRTDMVYLSTAYASYYALNATGKGKRKDKVLIVEIDYEELDTIKLYPDEDFILEVLNKAGHTSTTRDKAKADLEYYKEHYYHSIEKMGVCCYKGKIPINAITRMCIFDAQKRPELAMAIDPSVSIINYAIRGDFYKKLNSWFFGDTELLPHIEEDTLKLFEDNKYLDFWAEQSKDRTGITVKEISNGRRN